MSVESGLIDQCCQEDQATKNPSNADKCVTPEWRTEAIVRLFGRFVLASKENGSPLKDCWVPPHVVDPETGEIIEEKNRYQHVMINNIQYSAHVAVLTIKENRFPIRNRGKEYNEVGMHLCNNPACRNPLHLKYGTNKEDSEHKVSCGRAPSGEKNGHSTKPEQTPRGDTHYRSRLTGDAKKTACELLKKYGHRHRYAIIIGNYLGVPSSTIHYLKRIGIHLKDGVALSPIELDFTSRPGKSNVQTASIEVKQKMVIEMRTRFNEAPISERSHLLDKFEKEFGITNVTVRKYLSQKMFPDLTPNIPIPTEWGIGRRKSFKHKKSAQHPEFPAFAQPSQAEGAMS